MARSFRPAAPRGAGRPSSAKSHGCVKWILPTETRASKPPTGNQRRTCSCVHDPILFHFSVTLTVWTEEVSFGRVFDSRRGRNGKESHTVKANIVAGRKGGS